MMIIYKPDITIAKNYIANDFSRIAQQFKPNEKLYKHIGIYAYHKQTLLKIKNINPVKREKEESSGPSKSWKCPSSEDRELQQVDRRRVEDVEETQGEDEQLQ